MSQSNKVESQQHAERLRFAEMALEALRNVIKNNPGELRGYVYLSAVSLELLSKYFSWCNYRIRVGVHRSLQAALLLVAGSWSW